MIENADDIQTPLPDWRHDPRSDEELLHVALTEEDENLAWNAIAALHLRGSPDTLEAVRQLATSSDANERRVAADILGQLGKEDNKFHEESVTTLLGMLEDEQDLDVLHSIGIALGHRHDQRAVKSLARLKNHPDHRVRYGIVHGLMGHEDQLAINTLIELSADSESFIRDWATFGIGSMIETDTPAIRAALLARTTDEDDDARGEAFVGLARRHDERVVDLLLAELEAGRYGSRPFEAAAEIADPRLYPALLALWEDWGEDKGWPFNVLERALQACQPRPED